MPSVYHVEIVPDVVVDVYDVANAYSMPAEIAHAFKKIAVPGGRLAGKGEKQDIKEAIWSLNRYLDEGWLREAYRQTRKSGATGVDEMTAAQYADGLDQRLADLKERAKSGRYQAPPVRLQNVSHQRLLRLRLEH